MRLEAIRQSRFDAALSRAGEGPVQAALRAPAICPVRTTTPARTPHHRRPIRNFSAFICVGLLPFGGQREGIARRGLRWLTGRSNLSTVSQAQNGLKSSTATGIHFGRHAVRGAADDLAANCTTSHSHRSTLKAVGLWDRMMTDRGSKKSRNRLGFVVLGAGKGSLSYRPGIENFKQMRITDAGHASCIWKQGGEIRDFLTNESGSARAHGRDRGGRKT